MVSSLLDAPCDELNWMSAFLTEHTIAMQAAHPGLDLRAFDIEPDPFMDADVCYCRDRLFHLRFESIHYALANFAASSIGNMSITSANSRLVHWNLDVGFGGFRFFGLARAPFFLPRPLERIPGCRRGHDLSIYVSLWSRDQVA